MNDDDHTNGSSVMSNNNIKVMIWTQIVKSYKFLLEQILYEWPMAKHEQRTKLRRIQNPVGLVHGDYVTISGPHWLQQLEEYQKLMMFYVNDYYSDPSQEQDQNAKENSLGRMDIRTQ